MKFPWSMLKGCWVIVGHDANAKQLLAAYFALLVSRDHKVFVIQGKPLKEHLFEITSKNIVKNAVLDNIIILDYKDGTTRVLCDDIEKHIIFYEPPILPKCRGNCIVLTTPPLKRKLAEPWMKATLHKIYGHEYLLRSSSGSLRIVITPEFIGLSKAPSGILGEALNLLRSAIIDYGSITVRDAIDIIAYNLGMKRSEARNILGLLVERKYVAIDKNNVIVY